MMPQRDETGGSLGSFLECREQVSVRIRSGRAVLAQVDLCRKFRIDESVFRSA